jgi:hypothetical protein
MAALESAPHTAYISVGDAAHVLIPDGKRSDMRTTRKAITSARHKDKYGKQVCGILGPDFNRVSAAGSHLVQRWRSHELRSSGAHQPRQSHPQFGFPFRPAGSCDM